MHMFRNRQVYLQFSPIYQWATMGYRFFFLPSILFYYWRHPDSEWKFLSGLVGLYRVFFQISDLKTGI